MQRNNSWNIVKLNFCCCNLRDSHLSPMRHRRPQFSKIVIVIYATRGVWSKKRVRFKIMSYFMHIGVLHQIHVLHTKFLSRVGVNAILRNLPWAYNYVIRPQCVHKMRDAI